MQNISFLTDQMLKPRAIALTFWCYVKGDGENDETKSLAKAAQIWSRNVLLNLTKKLRFPTASF